MGIGVAMGHIVLRGLCREYVERRVAQTQIDGANSEQASEQGETRVVLGEIDLEIFDGELVCILGASGCGKSTLLRIVAGFDRPSSGSVVVDGCEVAGPSPQNIFVFQDGGLLPWMTVEENVGLGLRNIAADEERACKVREHIEMVDLTGFEAHYPHELSGGMKRRAELARALAVNPEILFMDEPFAGLDYLTRLRMREEIINMHEFFQKTVLFITHDIEEALAMADRIVVLSDRPAKVSMDLLLSASRPRDFENDHELASLRRRIYKEFGVHHAV